ncbi:MAG: hypothetical protein HY706_16420 [Candidatus Hydrogenedentes bacterium]|nr:hypothetical protein [Candidatus Hydrogenedentota bacterium]
MKARYIVLIVVFVLILVSFMLVGAAWLVASVLPSKTDSSEAEVRERLRQAKTKEADHNRAVQQGREAAKSAGVVSKDWDPEKALALWKERYPAAVILAEGVTVDDDKPYLEPDALLKLKHFLRQRKQLTDFEKAVDPDAQTPEECLERLRQFLDESLEMAELERAIEADLFRRGYKLRDLGETYYTDEFAVFSGSPYSNTVELLRAKALLTAGRGETAAAVRLWRIVLSLTSQTTDTPAMISEPFSCDYLYAAPEALLAAIDRISPLAEPQREKVLQALQTIWEVNSFRERVEIVALAKRLASTRMNPIERIFIGGGTVELYDVTKQLGPLLDKQPYEVRGELQAIQKQFGGTLNYWAEWHIKRVIEAFEGLSRRAFLADVAQVAFALRDYKRDHGEYPATLEALVPDRLSALPVEPVGGKPLVYLRAGAGFVLGVPRSASIADDEASWSVDETLPEVAEVGSADFEVHSAFLPDHEPTDIEDVQTIWSACD